MPAPSRTRVRRDRRGPRPNSDKQTLKACQTTLLSSRHVLLGRIDRHYETTFTAHEGFLILSQIALLLRRLDRSQLFDTP